jgi:RPA family protein
MKRETAWKVFAGEYNDSTIEIKGEGEMTPSYVVTPLGAKVNRLFIIGVLTDVENVSENGELVRAHISDPTGVFTLYSGQYQKDATNALSNIEVPAFVAVIGKSRTYTPEEGTLYVSVRPERIMEVSADIRDKWILETCKNTKDRIEAVLETMKMTESNSFELRKLGYSRELSEGLVEALKNYGSIDLNKYIALIQESLQYLRPSKETLPDLKIDEKVDAEVVEEKEESEIVEETIEPEEEEITKDEEPKATETKTKEEDKKEEDKFLEIENTVLETIKQIEGEDGAPWDSITEKCKKAGLDKDSIEEALTSLMDKGLIYEPTLGTIKTT